MLLFVFVLQACQGSSDAAGGAILSVSPMYPSVPEPTDNQEMLKRYLDAIEQQRAAGVRGMFVAKRWNEIEPSSGKFDLQDLKSGVAHFRNQNMQVFLGLQLINTVKREVPEDLKSIPFDDPIMLGRLDLLLNQVLDQVGPDLHYLSLGNEVDVYLRTTGEWEPYRKLFEHARATVHRRFPDLQVGITVTFDGATLVSRNEVKPLLTSSDVWMMTYYPLKGLEVRPAQDAQTDLKSMLNLTEGKPLVLQEVGYPASEKTGSSDEGQAEFFREVFRFWNTHQPRIPWLNVFMHYDFSAAQCKEFEAYYEIPDPKFHALMCSLGLIRADGTPRPAWKVFTDEASQLKN